MITILLMYVSKALYSLLIIAFVEKTDIAAVLT